MKIWWFQLKSVTSYCVDKVKFADGRTQATTIHRRHERGKNWKLDAYISTKTKLFVVWIEESFFGWTSTFIYAVSELKLHKWHNLNLITAKIFLKILLTSMLYVVHGACPLWIHDDVIKWKHFPRYWPFVRRILRSPVTSSHKGQWSGIVIFSLICAWIKGWVNNCEAGDLRRHPAYYVVTVMIETYIPACGDMLRCF